VYDKIRLVIMNMMDEVGEATDLLSLPETATHDAAYRDNPAHPRREDPAHYRYGSSDTTPTPFPPPCTSAKVLLCSRIQIS
jgi:hypothetical protein